MLSLVSVCSYRLTPYLGSSVDVEVGIGIAIAVASAVGLGATFRVGTDVEVGILNAFEMGVVEGAGM